MRALKHLSRRQAFRAGLVLSLLTVCCAVAAPPKRVLILDSFGRDVAPFNAAVSSFRTTLARDLGQPVNMYELPLEMARFASAGFEQHLVDFIEHGFSDPPVDLVVTIGAPAAVFAAQYRERLFAETPVLFSAVDTRIVSPELLRTNATLVTKRIDLPGQIEDILQLQPDTTNIVVVLGASPLEKFWAGECRREWQVFTNRVDFSWLDGLSLQQIQEQVQKLPPHSFVWFGMLVIDANQVPFDHDDALKAIHATAKAPIYGHFRSQFGLGTIGGRLYDDSQVGADAAKAAIRILRGERAADIPPQVSGYSPPVYDWRELTRWGISPNRLPAGSAIQFREPAFWEQYRWRIAGVLGFCGLQTALIIGLFVNRAKRREEEAAATLIGDLSSNFINLPPDEVDREIENAQRRVCECLGLDLSALWQRGAGTLPAYTLTHVYRPLGGPPTPEQMDGREYFPWCAQQLAAGKVIAVSSMDRLPPEAARDLETYRHYGVKSTLTIPLSAGGAPAIGFLSFNAMRAERTWPEAFVQRLQQVAQIIANALARKRADQALREGEERLRLAADSAALGLWSLNLADHHFWVTSRTRELLGLTADEIITWERFLGLVHPGDRARVEHQLELFVQSGEEGSVEYRLFRPDGRERWLLSRGKLQRRKPSGLDSLMGVTADITERKRGEEALHDFSARLISTQEEERSRLARELHDDITQRLARLAIDVGRSEAGTSEQSPAETARWVREELVRLSEDVHALSYRLHPSILEDLGLTAALRAEAEHFERESSAGIEVKVQDVPNSVSPETALCVFRVAQEAMRNATRHAGAQEIRVSLRGWDGGVQLAVQDDGCGFDLSLQRHRPSLGLASMRQRVHLLGGEVEIESTPGQGTTVLAWVPLRKVKADL